jgi:DNA modification methylase
MCGEHNDSASTTFTPNQGAPVHRWFRYSAGYSGSWAEGVIAEVLTDRPNGVVLDPFAGVGTTLVAGHFADRKVWGIEAHPLIYRIAKAKLGYLSVGETFGAAALDVLRRFDDQPDAKVPPAAAASKLLTSIFEPTALAELYALRYYINKLNNTLDDAASDLLWLCMISVLRSCSGAGTAPWQYVLPNKSKARVLRPRDAFAAQSQLMLQDIAAVAAMRTHVTPELFRGDARTMSAIPDASVDLVLTSPPYPNNYDYADATRIELTFLGEVDRWRDLHAHTRQHLMVSCSQHAHSDGLLLDELLAEPAVSPIRDDLADACRQLELLRQTRKGKKQYDTMIAAYFRDMSRVLQQIARVLRPSGRACLVIGDSAPYGVHVPVDAWLAQLGRSYGLRDDSFEQTRERNVKWKNRKHRVPLMEGRLWMTLVD